MRYSTLASILFALGATVTQAIDTVWVRTYHHYSEDRPYDMVIDELGNVYLAGFRVGQGTGWDFLCIKYYPDGETAWVRSYDGQDAKLWDVDVDRWGNVYAAGFSNVVGELDYTTVKYDANGNELWLRRYERPGQTNDHGMALCVDDSGNCYVTGDCYDGPEPIDGATIKYLPNGDTAWVRHGPGPANQNTDIAVDSAGNVYVTGTCYIAGRNGFWTAKYRPNGDTAWVRRQFWSMNGAGACRLALDASGVAVCGWRYDAGWNCDMAIIKYSPDGDSLWAATIDGGWQRYDVAQQITSTPDGGTCIAGTVSNGIRNFVLTAKYSAAGNLEWAVLYGDTLDDRSDSPYGIAVDNIGNVYVCTHSISSSDGNGILTIKYSPYGSEAWHVFYEPPQDGADACGIALLGDYVYVAGAGLYPGRYWDCVTIKYDQRLGVAEQKLSPVSFSCAPLPTVVRNCLYLANVSEEEREAGIFLLDILGRKVQELRCGVNNISALRPGVYYVALGTLRTAKVVKGE